MVPEVKVTVEPETIVPPSIVIVPPSTVVADPDFRLPPVKFIFPEFTSIVEPLSALPPDILNVPPSTVVTEPLSKVPVELTVPPVTLRFACEVPSKSRVPDLTSLFPPERIEVEVRVFVPLYATALSPESDESIVEDIIFVPPKSIEPIFVISLAKILANHLKRYFYHLTLLISFYIH